MKVGIIAYGFVGKSVHNSLEDDFDVRIYDPALGYKDRIDDTQACFICVPTPTQKGEQKLYMVEQSLNLLERYKGLIIIKSTILPKNLRKCIVNYPELRIIHVPEFLNQCEPYALLSGQHIVGCVDIFDANRYKHIMCLESDDIFICSPETASLIKYSHNVHGALLVSFWNEIMEVCNKENVDYRTLMYGLTSANNNVSRKYTRIGVDGKGQGFGGACFPKDILAFQDHYPDKHTIVGAITTNYKLREKEMSDCRK